MEKSLFAHIIDELARLKFSGRLSYHFYNEPLLRKDIAELIQFAKAGLPQANHVLYTNGDLLTDEKYDKLINAGIDLIYITSHSLKQFPARAKQIVYFPDDLKLTNRGGVLKHLPEVSGEILSSPCFAPGEMLIITTNGDVVLCYEDALRKNIMGNVKTGSIEDIWFSEHFTNIRDTLSTTNGRTSLEICSSCTNQAHVVRGLSHVSEP
jgi:2-deoxy-scyllo-inosamine dehydrogenase (SAM-dependent)